MHLRRTRRTKGKGRERDKRLESRDSHFRPPSANSKEVRVDASIETELKANLCVILRVNLDWHVVCLENLFVC